MRNGKVESDGVRLDRIWPGMVWSCMIRYGLDKNRKEEEELNGK